MSVKKNLIRIENTKFIFKTNFSGDPERDTYGSSTRKGNLIIPDHMQARDLIDMGLNVKATKPRPEEEEGFVPKYFVSVIVNYDGDYPPKIYLVSGNNEPLLLDGESIDELDKVYVLNVNAILNPSTSKKTGRTSLYVMTMYVEQDFETDPFRNRYGANAIPYEGEVDEE